MQTTRWFGLWIALIALVACGDDEPAPLSKLCGRTCPKTHEEAMIDVCMNPQGSGQWQDGRNRCGGWSVASANAGVGVQYDFDAHGKLVGAVAWTDQPDQDAVFGDACQAGGSFTEHACEVFPDAGVGD